MQGRGEEGGGRGGRRGGGIHCCKVRIQKLRSLEYSASLGCRTVPFWTIFPNRKNTYTRVFVICLPVGTTGIIPLLSTELILCTVAVDRECGCKEYR